MDEKPLFKTGWGKLVAFLVGALLVGGIAYFVLKYQDQFFKNVLVNAVKGSVTVDGGQRKGKLVAGEHLVSGDYVSVPMEGFLTLCADNNKYLYADEGTRFRLESEASLTKKGIRIIMESGSTLSVLDEKLEEGEVWQIETPTSTMAVRGTTFRVTVYNSGNEKSYTLLEVDKGSVKVNLIQSDGKFTGEEALFEVGECAVIRRGKKDANFMKNKDGDVKWKLDYDTLPEESVDRLVEILEDAGEQLEPEPEPVREPEPEPSQDADNRDYDDGPHEHVAGDWEITVAKKCTSNGTRVKRCTICGEILESEVIPAGHEFETTYSYPNGCNNNGTETITCKLCGETYMEVAYPRSHEFDYNNTRTSNDGALEVYCTVCGQYVGFAAPSINPPSYDEPDQVQDPATTYDDQQQIPSQATPINENQGGLDNDYTGPNGYDPNQGNEPPSGYDPNGG